LQPDELSSVTASGSNLFFTMASGLSFGPIPIPFVTWRWLGNYVASTNYFRLDWFNVPGSGIYLTLVDHVTADTFDPLAEDGDGNPLYVQISEAAAAGIAGLLDVLLTDLSDGQVLQWNATAAKWENVSLASVVGGAVSTLTDVILTSLADGEVLRYDAGDSAWRNQPFDTLPSIATALIMANISGGSAVPTGVTITALLDFVLGNTVGGVIVRGVTGWTLLAPGTSGYFLKTRGSGNAPIWDSPAGAGTVTSVATGTGLTGGPITGSGTVALAAVANLSILANISGGSAAPTPQTMTAILDAVFGTTRGGLLFRGASAWQFLGAGTDGYYLKTRGTTNDPLWDSPAGSGTVTSVASGTGLTGGPITGSGTLALAAIADGDFLANVSGGSAAPLPTGFSAFIDYVFASARGDIMVRGSSGWEALAPGIAGQVLKTGGAGADTVWASVSGTGTVTSVATGTGLTGGPITGSGTVSLAAITDGDFLANISGGSAVPTPTTISAALDYVFGSSRGGVLTRGASAWSFLAPGTSGYFLKSGGAGADVAWGLTSGLALSGTSLSVTGANGASFAVSEAGSAGHYFLDTVLVSYGANTDNVSTLQLGRARGTSVSPTAVQSGDVLGTIAGVGYGATAFFGGASIQFVATENWTDTHNGSKAQVAFVANGGNTPVLVDLITTGSNSLGASVSTSGLSDKDILVYDSGSTSWKNQRAKYILGSAAMVGVMIGSQKALYHRFTKAVTFPANFGTYLGHTSQAGGTANATASTGQRDAEHLLECRVHHVCRRHRYANLSNIRWRCDFVRSRRRRAYSGAGQCRCDLR
jgi:hypothetical protein